MKRCEKCGCTDIRYIWGRFICFKCESEVPLKEYNNKSYEDKSGDNGIMRYEA